MMDSSSWFTKFKASVFSQLILSYVFLVSGLIVNFLQLLTLIVWPYDKLLYRKLNYYLCYSLWCQLTALAQWWSGTTVDLYMNEDDYKHLGKENCICIVNHKYDIDWLIGWIICQKVGLLGGSKVLFKETIKYLPIMGWSWIFAENIFLKREWNSDSKSLTKNLRSLFHFPKDHYLCVIIFCEGTRFTEAKHKASVEFARSKGLPELKHHLTPRSKGFNLLMAEAADKIDVIYDCTVGVARDANNNIPNILNIKNGEPVRAKMHIRRIPVSTIPHHDENECSNYLMNLYKEKDEVYDVFDKTGDFSKVAKKIDYTPNKYDLYISLGWIILLLPVSLYYLVMKLLFGTIYFKLIFAAVVILVKLVITSLTKTTLIHNSSTFGLKKKD